MLLIPLKTPHSWQQFIFNVHFPVKLLKLGSILLKLWNYLNYNTVVFQFKHVRSKQDFTLPKILGLICLIKQDFRFKHETCSSRHLAFK